jgi:hypothetical protein
MVCLKRQANTEIIIRQFCAESGENLYRNYHDAIFRNITVIIASNCDNWWFFYTRTWQYQNKNHWELELSSTFSVSCPDMETKVLNRWAKIINNKLDSIFGKFSFLIFDGWRNQFGKRHFRLHDTDCFSPQAYHNLIWNLKFTQLAHFSFKNIANRF